MTDQLKIVRIHARNVPRIHGHKCLDDDLSLSLAPEKRRYCVLNALGCHNAETQKNNIWTTCKYLAVATKQYSCHDSMPSSL